jgi:hypothetical protein
VSQIDALFGGYASMAAALADPALAGFVRKDAAGDAHWDYSRVFDNNGAGIAIWNPTQAPDTTTTASGPDGEAVTVTQHQFQPGYALIASFAEPAIAPGQANPNAASVVALKAGANCLLIVDYDAWAANPNAAANTGFIYYAAASIGALSQWFLAPVPARPVLYPFGNA